MSAIVSKERITATPVFEILAGVTIVCLAETILLFVAGVCYVANEILSSLLALAS